jgi:DNA topoisomerase I
VLIFDGFMKVYGGGKDDMLLPVLQVGDQPKASQVCAHQNFSKPPARFSEASLVKTLEDLGIGRPSTYAPTISTIQTRGYVEKADIESKTRTVVHYCLESNKVIKSEETENYGGDKAKLLPTHLGDITTDFLAKYFASVIDSGFTASVEDQLDEIAEGKLVWQDSIASFYKHFHPLIEKAGKASRQETSQARLLGKDPKTKLPIYARFGKYGPMLQRGEVEKSEKKPDFAPMPMGKKIEEVTLDEALDMFSLPRLVGKTKDGKDISANIGRFGPYIKVDSLFISIKPLDPFSISETEAIEFYNNKLKSNSKRIIKTFDKSEVQILRGPYGPYITNGKKNARIPKSIKPESLDLKQAKEMLETSKTKRKFNKKAV